MNKFFLILFFGTTYQIRPNESTKRNSALIVIDTIQINDPIVVHFSEKNKHQSLLISRSYLSTIRNYNNKNYQSFIKMGNGYIFFTPSSFSCLINNNIHSNPEFASIPFYVNLQNDIRNAEKDIVFKNRKHRKKYKGWHYYEIYPKRFIIFSVLGRELRKCQSIEQIIIKDMDNSYFKVCVPITWD